MAPRIISALALAMLPAFSMAAAIPEALSATPIIPVADSGDLADIVGGSAAVAGQFPYQVALLRSNQLFCGGVLINANTVLTAAHCSVDYSASQVQVRAGSLQYASGGTLVGVSKIVVHPSYNDNTIDNDIALWKLATPISAGGNIGYATLPAQGSDPAAGVSTTVSGWGLTSESGSTLPASLRYVTVPVVSRATCRSEYGTSAVTDNMFCAAASGKDSCSGDSGGPIIIASTGVLAGTVSWGQGCAEAGFAGVYERIGNYVTYINTNKF